MYLLMDKIIWAGVFFKNPYFQHEYEYRIAFFTYTDKDDKKDDVPIEIVGEKKNHIEIYFDTGAVRNIICSPTDSALDLGYPKKYMGNAYPNFCRVQMSNIPFRVI